ncbi:CaiB/BaiF CoA transferase family protein [Variovorax sp. Root434]|uniref:CaiB/BaiF CoA transferase family protein n=1 Tax=Variovorax sp. Root434 TaxID=1736536 RepID=UPI0007000178|nr:CoA transferase [Variovorax sp. Root434]KQX21384.1 acetyl-CoA acetyltransferase [Variovorax sp. Root434]
MNNANTGEPTAAGPLDGIRVLDLTSVVLGPLATQVLADFGADVIKIEGPEGDLMRANGVSLHPGMSSIFLALNRNKRSVVLDLKAEEGAAALRYLLKTADVLVHNMRVAAIDRLGFGYEAVKAINPRIVYVAATGFQQSGPDRDKPAFDDIIQAACGLASIASVGRDAPGYVPSLIADKTTGLVVSNAVMAALVHRERNGDGQYVEVPMLETMAAFTLAEHMGGLTFPGSTVQAGYARLMNGGRQAARTSDGWIGFLPYTPKHWQAFFSAAGHEEICRRYDLSDRHQLNKNIKSLYRHLGEIMPSRSTDEWLALCEQLDIPATRIYSLDELPRHPQLMASGLFEQREHPTEGPINELRPTTLFQGTPASIRRPAPTLGQHTDEVLKEAGYKAPDLAIRADAISSN